ncbi:hypothetical protein [Streptomyces sp. NRRL S-37]|uniref:hypothetical protein n=1 Tax=Streptomyces sp. NRRL S-37 TaxID=1463903 RepID=UPI001F42C0AE|nr:hypothetical protein [Streptomyces sp. NRRL S-37]
MRRSVRDGRRTPGLRRVAVLVPAAGLLAALVSCTSQPDPLTTPCGVVVDGSGSGAATAKGFDAEAKLKNSLMPFLEEQQCGTVEFAPITRSSKSSSCQVAEVDLDPPGSETTDQESARAASRVVAGKKALEELECARTQNGSDVWGALDRISEMMPGDGPDAKLLVVSDFDQADKEFRISRSDLSTARKRETVIDTLVEQRGLPGLKGMHVYPVGLGMQYNGRPSESEDFEAFWAQMLEGRAQAHVHYDYR